MPLFFIFCQNSGFLLGIPHNVRYNIIKIRKGGEKNMETIKELLALGTAVIQLATAVVLLKNGKKGE